MKKEQALYRDRTVGILTSFQLLELSLKLYIGKSYDFIHALVGDRIHFDFSIEDVENYPLERLLNTFVKLNGNKELHKRLNKLRKQRNYIAHEALIVTIGDNPNMDTLHEKSREFFELEDELSDCLKALITEFENLHVNYVANA
ncbi:MULTISPECIES: hypothetical protein [Vibrio]|uniref:hypothetical protein n=1 Tax=Vibrio TaxID=662 RepID=UPI001CDD24FE|nr:MULTISPECIES: hypothetical protein [Vibrio]MCA2438574.1 hypothetical protein [Vibrio alginolyticus]MDW1729486.1 hypothetical protein [Vibrio sp. Vb2356]MDW1931168.1 hypothetical protein [Vibrio sp. 970]